MKIVQQFLLTSHIFTLATVRQKHGYGFKKPIGKGQRLIIMVHADGKDSFTPNTLLMFRSGKFQ
jgi:hypothetical protein